MAGLNDRERKMGIMIIAVLVVFAHVFGSKKLVDAFDKKKLELRALEQQAQAMMSGEGAGSTKEEQEWLTSHEPQPQTFEDVQTELQTFLTSAGERVGLTPFGYNLRQPEKELEEGEVPHYNSVRIEIAVQGEQDKIFQWLVNIHQPDKFRAITYVKIQANEKVEGEVICHIIAEQWFVPKM